MTSSKTKISSSGMNKVLPSSLGRVPLSHTKITMRLLPTYLLLIILLTTSVTFAFHTGSSMSSGSTRSNTIRQPSRTRQQQRKIQQRHKQQQNIINPTRLQFRDVEEEVNCDNAAASVTSTTGRISTHEEQETVDTYLEFLDRRYRRIHCSDGDNKEDRTKKTTKMMMTNIQKQRQLSQPQQQQTDDALYVLGLADLASQKLLRKYHHHLSSGSSSSIFFDDDATTKKVHDGNIDIETTKKESMTITTTKSVMNTVIMPFLQFAYFVQRQKRFVKGTIQKRVWDPFTRRVAANIYYSSDGRRRSPKSILNSILVVTGGQQNIFGTIAFGYVTTVLLFRPIIQAIFSEGAFSISS